MMRLSFRHLLWNGIVRWPIPEFGGGGVTIWGRVGMWYCWTCRFTDAVETPALIAHALVLQFLV
jgi:hypothetical protein